MKSSVHLAAKFFIYGRINLVKIKLHVSFTWLSLLGHLNMGFLIRCGKNISDNSGIKLLLMLKFSIIFMIHISKMLMMLINYGFEYFKPLLSKLLIKTVNIFRNN